jgi:bifunctional non-homologous end joining protein LigD
MEDEGLKPWPKVTGGKGYHVMAALNERMTHDEARGYAEELAERIAGKDRRYTTPPRWASGRHTFSSTICATGAAGPPGTWSPGARCGFPIARPVTWADVEKGIPPDAFAMAPPRVRPRTARPISRNYRVGWDLLFHLPFWHALTR